MTMHLTGPSAQENQAAPENSHSMPVESTPDLHTEIEPMDASPAREDPVASANPQKKNAPKQKSAKASPQKAAATKSVAANGAQGKAMEAVKAHGESRSATVMEKGERLGPEYPELARRRGQQGLVKIRCFINEEGKLLRAELSQSSGHSLLDKAALQAATGWGFSPALKDGKPVEGTVIVPIKFELR